MPSGPGSRGRRPQWAEEVAAPPVVQVSSSGSSGEWINGEGEEEEEEEEEQEQEERSEGSGEGARRRGGSANEDKAVVESEGEAEDPCLPSCPICMVAWTADGPHRVSCIPCGHVYGRHCLEVWLVQCGKKKAPCPQCGKRYTQNNIINLYVPEIAVPSNDLEKQVLSLREKNESLETQQAKLLEEIKEYKRQIMLQRIIIYESSSKRQKMKEQSSDGIPGAEPIASLTKDIDHRNLSSFTLQDEILVDGARVMGIDATSKIIFTSGRAHGVSPEHILTKISMLNRRTEKIHLPPDTKAIRDICVLPGGHVAFASLGRKLSLLSMATNNVVLQYDLPSPGWSCSGDYTTSTHIYAGLQNGMLLVFDIRQTSAPLHSSMGLSTHPVHTIHCAVDDRGSRRVFSASSIGPCVWDVSENSPSLVSGMENQGVCISLACASPSSDLLVASYRPRVELPDDSTTTQAATPQSPAPTGSGRLGCHTLFKRTTTTSFAKDHICSGSVSDLRLSKSAIIPCSDNQHLFAYGDETLYGIRAWELPSFQRHTDLRPHSQPILDLRFAESSAGERYLGCLSAEKLQVFTVW